MPDPNCKIHGCIHMPGFVIECGYDEKLALASVGFGWADLVRKGRDLERLRAAGIQPVGAGQNILAAHYPLLVHVGSVRIAFLAYVNIDPKEATAGVDRPGVAWLDPAQALTDIRFARPLADLVIVCPHWGVEYALKPTRDQVDLAHQMIDAGADMIVGSHPHVVQPVEKYYDCWVAYSLGNFIFDQQDRAIHHSVCLLAPTNQ